MQYVFLSYAARHGEVTVRRHEALVEAYAFNAAVEDIIGAVTARLKRVAGKRFKGPISGVSDLKEYCDFLGKLSVSPKPFSAGGGDKKLLQSFLESLGASRVCQKGPSWLEAALTYGLTILAGGSVTTASTSRLDMPWMAKATVFSYARDSLGKTQARVSVEGLGTLLLGGAASLLGSHGKSHQVFLVPEGVEEGVAGFIAWLEEGDVSPVAEAFRVSGETGASLEIVFSLVLAEHVSRAGGFQPGGWLPPMRLLLVDVSGNRPLTLEGVPVSMAVAKHSWGVDVSSKLLSLYRAAAAGKQSQAREAASGVFTLCSYSVYHAAGGGDRALHLAECAREVHRLIHLSEAGRVAAAARRALKSIAEAVG